MKSLRALLSLSVLLGVAGCDGGSPEPAPDAAASSRAPSATPTVEGSDLAVRITAPPPEYLSIKAAQDAVPSADDNAPVLDQVIQEMRRETLLRGRIKGDIEGRCEGGRIVVRPLAQTRCTASYAGVTLPWVVTIAEDYRPTDRLIQYTFVLEDKSVLRAKAVYGAFWDWYDTLRDIVGKAGQDPRLSCDTIPDAQLAIGETPYRCQHLDFSILGEPRWARYVVKVDGKGMVTFDSVRS